MLHKAIVPLLLLLALPVRVLAQADTQAAIEPEIMVVTGRLPGPTMWRVVNGDNVLWIFPSFAPVPKRMEWDSTLVRGVLADAGVYLTQPASRLSLSSPPGGPQSRRVEQQFFDGLSRIPDGKTLQDELGPELYLRYAAVKAQYFPRDDDIEEMRPFYAMQSMRDEVQQEVGLAPANAILDEIERLARRNRQLLRIDTSTSLKVTMEWNQLADRFGTLMNSLAPEAARDCFELELRRIEIDLDAIKHRANEWANGRIGAFRAVQLRTGDNPCGEIFFTSSESETMQELARQSQEKWLAGAEDALTNHLTSFAVLDIDELLNEDGLLSRLVEKGYSVRAPN
jgi:hypothetical protein